MESLETLPPRRGNNAGDPVDGDGAGDNLNIRQRAATELLAKQYSRFRVVAGSENFDSDQGLSDTNQSA